MTTVSNGSDKKNGSSVMSDLAVWQIPDFHVEKINELLKDVMVDYMSTPNKEKLGYQCRHFNGDERLLRAIAKFLSKEYEDTVESSNLFTTYGASYGTMLLITHYFEKGDYCILEDLTFKQVKDVAVIQGLNTVSVISDDEGISLSHLEEQLIASTTENKSKKSKEKPFNGMIYLMTVLHNPKGRSYSTARCKAIVELARRYNFLVITDDVYNIYQYGAKKAQRLRYYDKLTSEDGQGNHVVSNASFSKILFPSLRLGWIECPEWMVKDMTIRPDLIAGGGYNYFNQLLTANLLASKNYPVLLDTLIRYYSRILDVACDVLKLQLPNNVVFNKPEGSFFLWLQLPVNCAAKDVVELCADQNVAILPGNFFAADGESYSNYLRISIANVGEEELKKCLNIICNMVKKVVQ